MFPTKRALITRLSTMVARLRPMLLSCVVCAATAFTLPARWTIGKGAASSTSLMMADVGAASTAFYTDEVRKESYPLMPDVLSSKVADPDLRKLMLTLFDAFATVSAALRKELVVKAEEQKSVFGDVQLGVDVLADELLWEVCHKEGLVKTGSSEEEPDVREMHASSGVAQHTAGARRTAENSFV